MKINKVSVIIPPLIALTVYCAHQVYNAPYSEIIIDYIAFFAGIFLAIEAIYTIVLSNNIVWPHQLSGLLRLAIGTCIFSIHTLQFIR